MIEIPYNILVCNFCKTIQNKYLCNLDIVYKYSSSYGYGKTYEIMNVNFCNLLLKYKQYITNIIEIGSGNGKLCDKIINLLPTDLRALIVSKDFLNRKSFTILPFST